MMRKNALLIFSIAALGTAVTAPSFTRGANSNSASDTGSGASRGGAAGLSVEGAAKATLGFNRDVRAILSDNCFACHGPDEKNRKAGLRLDVREEAVKEQDSGGTAIIPGKADESELIRRIVTDDEDEKMPPAKSHKTVTPAQLATLKQWINEGATYQKHWAFEPPVMPPVPSVKDAGWTRTPIDQFILARLERDGLKPSAEADKTTLLRRLYLDLVGLPPTPEQVDAFLADRSPDAYSKVVEELLASPHYGERWGRHWLDAARYADTNGYEKDAPRLIYFYRDWVISAFNRDLPYDQFIVEQLAGDQLPNATQDQRVATGYLRNAMLNEEGGVDPEQFRMEGMFDRMDAIGKGVLGLTIQCAQCHTHKFDPITHNDYYRLFAFLNNDDEASRVVYTPEGQAKVANLMSEIRSAEDALRHGSGDWQAKFDAWQQEQKTRAEPNWQVLTLKNTGDNGQRYTPIGDGSLRAGGFSPPRVSPTFSAPVKANDSGKPTVVSAVRLELLTDQNLPCGGPGRSEQGLCALSEFGVSYVVGDGTDEKIKRTKVEVKSATADYEEPEARPLASRFADDSGARDGKAPDPDRVTGPVALAIDGNGKTAWGIDAGPGRRNADRKAVFTLKEPIEVPAKSEGAGGEITLFVTLNQSHGGVNANDNVSQNLGRFRVSVCGDAEAKADPLPRRVRQILAVAPQDRSQQQAEELFAYWRTTVPEWKDANAAIEKLWQQWPEGVSTLTLAAREKPRETHLFDRGDWLSPKQAVKPGVPSFLNPLPKDADTSRLTLARWMTSRDSPTTARVLVNRVWQHYFGIGLVASAEDLGTQSEAPSNPELLDWLAVRFMDDGWSIKKLHRLIVNSATYRQSSRVTPDLLERDPYNRLVARAGRFRVEGEIVRDIALATSGLLNSEIGGRSVMPPAPAFLFEPPASYGAFPWKNETDNEKYRRAVYTYRRRTTPYPVLQTFDVPNGDAACVRRLRTNSPLQALAALNEPMFVESAAHLAKLSMEQGGRGDGARLAYAFRRVMARQSSEAELAELLSLLSAQRQRFESGELKSADLLTGVGLDVTKLPADTPPNDLAAMTVVARVLLNLDEAMTRE